ncbi:MAG TPA: alpha/beta hydrolase [Baekduia sp.]|nr:alpha/beta hydrolase [Baekduia sp.]
MALTAGIVLVPGAHAQSPAVPTLDWQDCDDGFQCASAAVPLDYTRPDKAVYHVALIRKPATNPGKRLGSLFTNPGGPGASGVDFVRATADSLYATLNQQYDIVGFDPRGTGASDAALDCRANQEQQGIYSIPYATPDTDRNALLAKDKGYVKQCVQLNKPLLPYVTTGNVARDLDLLRQAVGDKKLNYLGFSYGTFLGATYAALFPSRLGRVVLDGPVDADAYINHPTKDLQAQTSAFERELDRFFQACAADQVTCQGFGGTDPHAAFDALVEQANAHPIPADGFTADPRPVTGDDILNATIFNLYAKPYWAQYIAPELAAAAAGDGSGIRSDSDYAFGYDPGSGTFDPGTDRYFLIGAIEQKYSDNLERYFRLGKASYDSFDHFWFNNGYVELNYGLFPIEPNGRYGGPFKIPGGASTPLVVATTYDPATPYRGAKALVKDLGNARLLTMVGDGHTAYGGNSACVDEAVDSYMLGGTLPAAGTVCRQEVPFGEEPTTSPYAATDLSAQKLAAEGGRPTRVGGLHEKPVLVKP